MKNKFLEYNSLSDTEVKSLWGTAIFVFDTNILLNLYRYSDETSKQFLETIIKLKDKDKVWLPFRVALEFNRNRLKVISEQKKIYEDFDKNMSRVIGDIENKDRNPFLSDSLFKKLSKLKDDMNTEIAAKIKNYNDSINKDPLLEKINSAFEGKVGDDFNAEELKALCSEGEKRYNDKVPPGFKDSDKPGNEKYSDLMIWKQIMIKSKDTKKDIIFISYDKKEDWWHEHEGKTISARPELLKEFRTNTSKNCHFYRPFQFLEYSNKYLGSGIKAEIISEVKNYKLETKLPPSSTFIKVQLTVQCSGSDLDNFISEIKSAGYNIHTESTDTVEMHIINVVIPSIPDLERRLNDKYIVNLYKYNIILLDASRSYFHF